MKKFYAMLGILILLGCAPVKAFVNQELEVSKTNPVLSITPKTGEFGGVQLGETGTVSFTIKNTGVSVLKIKKLLIEGGSYTLADLNTYPFEVIADSGFSFPVGNSGKTLNFTVTFSPADIGIVTGKVVITYGLYSDEILEIPLTGEGLSCHAAAVAVKGENLAPRQDSWFKYTADKFSIVEINSCHPHQKRTATDFWDLFLYIYSNCNGTLVAGHSEPMYGNCVYDSQAISHTTIVKAGETIYFFWPLFSHTSLHARDSFYFNIKVTYPLDGDICESAVPLTLPVVNHFGTTAGFRHDYLESPCTPNSGFMGGNDKVYTITTGEEGYLTGNILGAYASLHILDMCPVERLTKDHCRGYAAGPNGGQFHKKIDAGTYYVVVSNWAPPQSVDYLLNLSWEGVSDVANNDLETNLNVFPNPANDQYNVVFTSAVVTNLILELADISGQIVYRKEMKAAYNFNEVINTSQLSKGLYFLKATTSQSLKTTRLLLQ